MEEWGRVWQINFAPEKMQAMVISRSPVASQAVSGLVCFGNKCLSLEEYIKVLGVAMDSCLHFNHHVAVVT